MSEYLHPGSHPDADSLNAFIEGVLPEHERLGCLAHLADCPRCREIVYLAQEPVAPAPIPALAEAVPFWKRWFTPMPALAAAVVCVLLVSVGVYRLNQPKRVEPVLTAIATPSTEPPAPLSEPLRPPPAPRPAKSVATRQPASPVEPPAIIPNAAPAAGPVVAAQPPPPPAPQVAMAGIAGTVTDPAGAAVPGAVVTVRPVTGTPNIDTRTDNNGQFTIAGLLPGRYELQFVSPGFKQAKKQIDLQPQLVARADSTLEVGAAAETVTVNAEATLLKTESGEISRTTAGAAASALPVLPPNRRTGAVSALAANSPPSTTASRDKLMLRTDSFGAIFLSKNGGKSWKAVKPSWNGKVVRVELAHDAGAVFQLTTDSGSVWLSRDGTRWNPAAAR